MKKKLVIFAFLGLAVLISCPSYGTVIYSCDPGLSTCNGNEYAVSVLSHVGNTYQLEFDILVLGSYTGNHWTDYVKAVELKDFVAGTYSNFTLVSAPGGVSNWSFSQNELNASGCTGGSNGNRLCAEAKSPYNGAPVIDPSTVKGDEVLTWVFQFDTTNPLNDDVHIKYLYVDSNGRKEGDLGSWDIDIQTVPEPATLLLLGTGLIGLAAWGRKKR